MNTLQRKVVWATRKPVCRDLRNLESTVHRTLYELAANTNFDYADIFGPDQLDSIVGLSRVALLGTRKALASGKCQASIATWKRKCTRTSGR